MNLSEVVGNTMTVTSSTGRTYTGILRYLNPQTLTITLENSWSKYEYFDIITIKATDILSYQFLFDPSHQTSTKVSTYKKSKKMIKN
jgi:hypothetical protein